MIHFDRPVYLTFSCFIYATSAGAAIRGSEYAIYCKSTACSNYYAIPGAAKVRRVRGLPSSLNSLPCIQTNSFFLFISVGLLRTLQLLLEFLLIRLTKELTSG